MLVVHFIWLLLCYAQYARSDFLAEYEDISNNILSPPDEESLSLPVELGKDKTSGCLCRASANHKVVVCFGNYDCRRFPKVPMKSDLLIVRTTVMSEIKRSELDSLNQLKVLKIEANHQLRYLEPGVFQNLTRLQQLSLSYNTGLRYIHEETFKGLVSLRNLTLVNNGFTNILQLTPAFKPSILPSLKGLDLSENSFERIPANAFLPMRGITIRRLEINLCRLEYIDPNSFLPLKHLDLLRMRENELNATLIGDLLWAMRNSGINLTQLDLSGMGFRKQPPAPLMNVIAKTTIQRLILSGNQFEIISDDAFPRMPNIKVLDLRSVYAISISENAFQPANFPSLRVLLLGGNSLPGIHKKHISNEQLLILDLSHNRGSSDSPLYYEIDREAFTKCHELKVLNLAYNGIKSVFNYTFIGLERLKKLNLENGTIFHIGDGTFQPMRNLEMLNLANNPIAANSNLTSAISMYRTYMWLQVNGSVILNQYFANSKFQCSSPDVWENRSVADYLSSIKRLRCLMYNKISNLMFLMWTAPSLITIVFLAFIIYIIYKYRTYIRYWIFLSKVALGKRLMWKTSQKTTRDTVYKYDAFVSYCGEDRDFVAEMISQLESNPPYLKLCIYERDFEIGAFISECVCNGINESRYVILIVSNSFAKSQWCRWEMNFAEYHRLFLEDGTTHDPLVIIKIGEVEKKYLTTPLRYLLKTKIYHLWDERHPDKFWKRLRTVLVKNKPIL
ncbi:uncharacterized protein [Epargyreus clarus]|uniref:uncharacterized protein n=1 Tax=Epargyreus clarus TaxID=520877 RepID=UPI003C2E38F0